MAYLLDSDVFIAADNSHFAYEFCPGFWEWLDVAHADGRVLSINEVRDEIEDGRGYACDWVKARHHMFMNTQDGKTYESLKLLSAWASSTYEAAAQDIFFAAADFPLVGYAHAHGHQVVTQEKWSNGKQIKVPNACEAVGMRAINTWDLLKAEKVKLVLEK